MKRIKLNNMGEYARRKTSAHVKIGTCSSMYYCRYDQRNQIEYGYNDHDYMWHIPAIEEDGIEPGDFEFQALIDSDGFPAYSVRLRYLTEENFPDLDYGTTQIVTRKTGMLVNVPCGHGVRLPKSTEDIRFFFNGRRGGLMLDSLLNTDDDLKVCIACIECGKIWSTEFEEICKHIVSFRMLMRLWKQVSDYRAEHGGKPCTIPEWDYYKTVPAPEDYRKSSIEKRYVITASIKEGEYVAHYKEFDDGEIVRSDIVRMEDFDKFERTLAECVEHSFEYADGFWRKPDAYLEKKHTVLLTERALSLAKSIIGDVLPAAEWCRRDIPEDVFNELTRFAGKVL